MRICCLSDLHGHLPPVPDCDLLLLGGDYCRDHTDLFWYARTFKAWVDEAAKTRKVIGVAGNHDFIFQEQPDMVPAMDWEYLEDSGTEWNGLKIWGSPWQPRFFDWAFNADEPDLKERWALVPEGTDILLLHGPPRGYGDKVPRRPAPRMCGTFDDDKQWPGHEHTGSPSLLARILEVKPKLVVAGHIHSGYGVYKIGDHTTFVSAALVNEQYQPAHEPIVWEL